MKVFMTEVGMVQMRFKRALSFLLALSCLLMAACDDRHFVEAEIADYGSWGADFARDLATRFPRREAGSEGEAGAAELIEATFRELGYEPERQSFELPSGGSSQNLVVRVPGQGFHYVQPDPGDPFQDEKNQAKVGEEFQAHVIVAASYNTPELNNQTVEMETPLEENPDSTGEMEGEEPAETMEVRTSEAPPLEITGFQGISDNASGVGALMTLAKQLKQYQLGYDVTLVALGGANENYAGARDLLARMSEEEQASCYGFYEIRNIYAGNKLYAHGGWSSLVPGQKYEMRRRAYVMTDVAIENGLIDTHGTDLYLNEAGFYINNPLGGEDVVYSEFTQTVSNYRIFDAVGIPIVFFEAYDYDGRDLASLTESRNPNFAPTNGHISGTAYDQIGVLEPLLEEGQLEERINLMAFIIAEGFLKEPPDTEISN